MNGKLTTITYLLFSFCIVPILCSYAEGEKIPSDKELVKMFHKSVLWVNLPDTAKENREKLIAMGPGILPSILPVMKNEFLMQQYGLQDIIYGMLGQYKKTSETEEKTVQLNKLKIEIAGYLREHCVKNSYEGLRWVVRWLAELKVSPEEDIAAIGKHVDHDYWRVRSSCASSLGLYESDIATPYIRELIKDPEEEVRAQAAYAAGLIKDAALIPSLCERLEDPLFTARMNSADSLVKLAHAGFGKEIEREIGIYLDSDKPMKTRYIALEILGRAGDENILNTVLPYLESKDRIMRGLAVESAAATGTDAVKEILDEMYDKEKDMFVIGKLEKVKGNNFGDKKKIYPRDYK